MGLLKKIITAIRGGAREAGETIVDANAFRILEQEIIDAKKEIEHAKKSLASLMVTFEKSQAKIAEQEEKIKEHEGYAMQALEKSDETLAVQIAERIAEFEEERDYQAAIVKDLEDKIERQKSLIKEAARTVEKLERDSKMVKSTAQVQKTTSALNDSFSNNNSRMSSAAESLERIKQRQAQYDAEIKASKDLSGELAGDELEKKLKAAGIKTAEKKSTNDILARLKAKQEG